MKISVVVAALAMLIGGQAGAQYPYRAGCHDPYVLQLTVERAVRDEFAFQQWQAEFAFLFQGNHDVYYPRRGESRPGPLVIDNPFCLQR